MLHGRRKRSRAPQPAQRHDCLVAGRLNHHKVLTEENKEAVRQKSKAIEMDPEYAEAYAGRPAHSEAAPEHPFPGRNASNPWTDIKRFWKSILSISEIEDYRVHYNRHTHASHLVSSCRSLAIVGRLLGHTNPLTTQRYTHLADDPLREAAEIMARKMK